MSNGSDGGGAIRSSGKSWAAVRAGYGDRSSAEPNADGNGNGNGGGAGSAEGKAKRVKQKPPLSRAEAQRQQLQRAERQREARDALVKRMVDERAAKRQEVWGAAADAGTIEAAASSPHSADASAPSDLASPMLSPLSSSSPGSFSALLTPSAPLLPTPNAALNDSGGPAIKLAIEALMRTYSSAPLPAVSGIPTAASGSPPGSTDTTPPYTPHVPRDAPIGGAAPHTVSRQLNFSPPDMLSSPNTTLSSIMSTSPPSSGNSRDSHKSDDGARNDPNATADLPPAMKRFLTQQSMALPSLSGLGGRDGAQSAGVSGDALLKHFEKQIAEKMKEIDFQTQLKRISQPSPPPAADTKEERKPAPKPIGPPSAAHNQPLLPASTIATVHNQLLLWKLDQLTAEVEAQRATQQRELEELRAQLQATQRACLQTQNALTTSQMNAQKLEALFEQLNGADSIHRAILAHQNEARRVEAETAQMRMQLQYYQMLAPRLMASYGNPNVGPFSMPTQMTAQPPSGYGTTPTAAAPTAAVLLPATTNVPNPNPSAFASAATTTTQSAAQLQVAAPGAAPPAAVAPIPLTSSVVVSAPTATATAAASEHAPPSSLAAASEHAEPRTALPPPLPSATPLASGPAAVLEPQTTAAQSAATANAANPQPTPTL